jgi:hypothetical protein
MEVFISVFQDTHKRKQSNVPFSGGCKRERSDLIRPFDCNGRLGVTSFLCECRLKPV